MSNASKNSDQKPSSKLLLILGLVGAIVLIVLFLQNKKPGETSTADTGKKASDGPAAIVSIPRPEPKIDIPEEAAQEPETNAVTAYLIEDFTDPKFDWKDYKLENLKVTPQGIELADGATSGTLLSPPKVLVVPANMVAPLWKQEVPKGSSVKIEQRISTDNQTWSPWYPIEDSGNDINPVYPDGKPNPNYGYVPGNYVSLNGVAPFMQYRAVLSKTGGTTEYRRPDGQFPDTLRLNKMRFYHLDSMQDPDHTLVKEFPPGPSTGEEQKTQ